MAMRPPVPVPTLSRRAKLVIGAIAVLLVLFTVIGTLTNVYVDYLWFDETGYTEVFWTELQTRAAAVRRGRGGHRRAGGAGGLPGLPVPPDVPADVAWSSRTSSATASRSSRAAAWC